MFESPPKSAFRVHMATLALLIVGITLLVFSLDGLSSGHIVVRSRGAQPYVAYAAGPYATAFAWNAWGCLALGTASLGYGLWRCARYFRKPGGGADSA
ncbi:hypothetical protein J2X19_002484 [Rhodoferax ferrireducens]|uniref:Transmembrane protein n=1 Tax=Rhodoferax ferrireducens TaxID=192843 RepID=A0ABU2C8Z8_9BURK|nr:hypothetical protein [Rhodoferax ferrireducens]